MHTTRQMADSWAPHEKKYKDIWKEECLQFTLRKHAKLGSVNKRKANFHCFLIESSYPKGQKPSPDRPSLTFCQSSTDKSNLIWVQLMESKIKLIDENQLTRLPAIELKNIFWLTRKVTTVRSVKSDSKCSQTCVDMPNNYDTNHVVPVPVTVLLHSFQSFPD